MSQVTYAFMLRDTLAQGLPMHAALRVLRERGASPAEAAEAVGLVTGSAGEIASAVVRNSGAWSLPRTRVAPRAARAPGNPVQRHGRSGHGAATVLPHLVSPYVVRPGQDRTSRS